MVSRLRTKKRDLATITTTGELRLAEALGDPQGSLRPYIAEVSLHKEPLYERTSNKEELHKINDEFHREWGNGKEIILH